LEENAAEDAAMDSAPTEGADVEMKDEGATEPKAE